MYNWHSLSLRNARVPPSDDNQGLLGGCSSPWWIYLGQGFPGSEIWFFFLSTQWVTQAQKDNVQKFNLNFPVPNLHTKFTWLINILWQIRRFNDQNILIFVNQLWLGSQVIIRSLFADHWIGSRNGLNA